MSSTSILQRSKSPRAPKATAQQPTAVGAPSKVRPAALSFNEQFIAELTRNMRDPAKNLLNNAVHQEHDATPKKSGFTAGYERLTEGTLELARAVLYCAIEEVIDAPPQEGQSQDFRAAYSAILRAVPEERRHTLLLGLRKGLEDVAKAELEATPATNAARSASISTADFMAGLETQEADQRARDVAEGRLVPAAAMAALLKVSPQAVGGALKAKRIFALRGPSGGQVYPAFFADEHLDRKVLEKVSKILGDLPGATKWDFFISPRLSLDKRTPLEALAKGKVDAVMTAARAVMEE